MEMHILPCFQSLLAESGIFKVQTTEINSDVHDSRELEVLTGRSPALLFLVLVFWRVGFGLH
jgi:hypothetical protein